MYRIQRDLDMVSQADRGLQLEGWSREQGEAFKGRKPGEGGEDAEYRLLSGEMPRSRH